MNIAEGCGRETERELARFLSMAAGSASEVEYQLLLARDLNYIYRMRHIKNLINRSLRKKLKANS
jgi:four helix bundle protein